MHVYYCIKNINFNTFAMKFEDLFNNNKHKQSQKNYFHDNSFSHKAYYSEQGNLNLLELLNNIRKNKKLKVIVFITIIILIAILIGLIMILLPLIINVINYISQHGVAGVLDMIMGFLNNLLSGS